MHVVLCVDQRVLPGLHVAAYSLLDRVNKSTGGIVHFHLFSDDLSDLEVAFLKVTLERTGNAYTLERHRVNPARFAGFPLLNGSLTTYYRLLVPEILEVDRFLYVDADTLCDVDVTPLRTLDLGNFSVAWVPEAPLSIAIDRAVAQQLGNRDDAYYFNAGVMLVDVGAWRAQQNTERALRYLINNHTQFHDQSALNYILHNRARHLDAQYNCIANHRPSWMVLRRPYGQIGRLVHFLDYPKPWSFLGELVHPHYRLWRSVFDKTALSEFRSWHSIPSRKWAFSLRALRSYKKSLKDRVLFGIFRRGWVRRVKGMEPF